MKKLILCLLAFSFLTFVSCKKDKEENKPVQQEEVNPAKDFEGDYTISGTLTVNLPAQFGGEQSMPIESRDLTITLKGNKGDVVLTSGEYTIEGYVNDKGLHIDPIVVDYPIMQTTVQLTLTIPAISKPVNGTTTCQASAAATVMGMTITGMADIVATKK